MSEWPTKSVQLRPPRRRPTVTGSAKILPTFGYYLTFIHYFGFSINPDDVNTRYLSIKIKRTNTRAGASEQNLRRPEEWLATYRLRARNTFGFTAMLLIRTLKICTKFTAISFTTFIAFNHIIVLGHYIYDGEKALMELMLELRLTLTKFSALIFVLSWHLKQAKVRQLIKLVKSTTVHILSSQTAAAANDSMHADCAPDLKRSGTIKLIARAHQEKVKRVANGAARRPPNPGLDGCDSGGGGEEENQDSELGDSLIIDTAHIDRRILRWWLMCVLISAIHFSLSEAELTKSHHLWQWLEDYSLHQLDNATTSTPTLMFLASFDNYIYTVHVYGTRLIGASIICIVCSLQRESIDALRARTLEMIKAVPVWKELRLLDQLAGAQTRNSSLVAAATAMMMTHKTADNCREQLHSRKISRALIEPQQQQQQQTTPGVTWLASSGGVESSQDDDSDETSMVESEIDRELFFILGESSWLKVCARSSQRPPAGYLSSSIWLARLRLSNWVHRLAGRAKGVVDGELLPARAGGSSSPVVNGVLRRLVSKGTVVCATGAACESLRPRKFSDCDSAVTQTTDDCTGSNPSLHGREKTTPNPTLANGAEPRETPKRMTSDNSQHTWRSPAKGRPHEAAHLGGPWLDAGLFGAPNRWPLLACLGSPADSIESKLERLASKYELIRTVNARIDACFGPMLLTQYFFLFLMSCIDVVYFSLCFNPNTKTKYIIISGMILLWWPYLLLYKFASDIGTSSKRLLVSVRRLARLSLIEHYALNEINAAQLAWRPTAHDHLAPYKRPTTIRATDSATAPTATRAKNYLTKLNQLSAMDPFVGLCRRPPFKGCNRPPDPMVTGQWRLTGDGIMMRNATKTVSSANQRANIINKLDHVFEPNNLSIMGIMTIDKFFLINFAKIVITASVMIIQFISN